MRFASRLTGLALTLFAVSFLSLSVPLLAQDPPQHAATAPTLTFNGDIALWTVAIKPDKTADFEAVMRRLRDALMKSADPNRRKQAEGWKVMKLDKPLPDGNIAYVHVINPVVPGADYTVMQTLYDAFPDERQALYDMYRGAFAQNLSLATGSVILDMSKAQQSSAR
jgi:hypothetical protein